MFKIFYDLGFNLFIYDMRGYGKSYGNESTYGFYEKYDLSECIDWVKKRLGENEVIGLYGDEVGAATSIFNMLIDDRAYFCIAENVYSDLKSYLFPQRKCFLDIRVVISNIRNKIINGFWYGQVSPLKEINHINKPLLTIDAKSIHNDSKIKEFINTIFK